MALARPILHKKILLKSFWAQAMATAMYVRNCVAPRALSSDTTPHHIWGNRAPSLLPMRKFGCAYWYALPKQTLKKLHSCSRAADFIKYSKQSMAYKLLDLESFEVIVSRDVTFDENVFPKFHSNDISTADFDIGDFGDKIPIMLLKVGSLTPRTPLLMVRLKFVGYICCVPSVSPKAVHLA